MKTTPLREQIVEMFATVKDQYELKSWYALAQKAGFTNDERVKIYLWKDGKQIPSLQSFIKLCNVFPEFKELIEEVKKVNR